MAFVVGFRAKVSGSGFTVRVLNLVFGVWGLGFRVLNLVRRV